MKAPPLSLQMGLLQKYTISTFYLNLTQEQFKHKNILYFKCPHLEIDINVAAAEVTAVFFHSLTFNMVNI